MMPYQQYLQIPIDENTKEWLKDMLETHYTFATPHPFGGMPRYLFDLGLLEMGPSQYKDCCAIKAGQVEMEVVGEPGAWFLVVDLT